MVAMRAKKKRTRSVNELGVVFARHQRIGQISEELLQQACNTVDVVEEVFWIAEVDLGSIYICSAVFMRHAQGICRRPTVVEHGPHPHHMRCSTGKTVNAFDFQAK